MKNKIKSVPSALVFYASNGGSTKASEFGMWPMQECIYIGCRFKNDTERLEKLFELYTKMTTAAASLKSATKPRRGGKA